MEIALLPGLLFIPDCLRKIRWHFSDGILMRCMAKNEAGARGTPASRQVRT